MWCFYSVFIVYLSWEDAEQVYDVLMAGGERFIHFLVLFYTGGVMFSVTVEVPSLSSNTKPAVSHISMSVFLSLDVFMLKNDRRRCKVNCLFLASITMWFGAGEVRQGIKLES